MLAFLMLMVCLNWKNIKCLDDQEVKQWQWSMDLFLDSPKQWMSYIFKFMEKIHRQTAEIHGAKISSFLTHASKAVQLVAPTCNDGNLISKRTFLESGHGTKRQIYTFVRKHTAIRPTGRLCHDSFLALPYFVVEINKLNKEQLSDCFQYGYHVHYIYYSWHFLAKEQSLQFITESVDIPKDYQGCNRGQLSVHNVVSFSHILFYSFCGKYASVTHYSSDKEVDIELWYLFKQNIHINILFTVLDTNILETSVLNYSTHGPHLLVHHVVSSAAWFYLLNINVV